MTDYWRHITLLLVLLAAAPASSKEQALKEPTPMEPKASTAEGHGNSRHMHPPFRLLDTFGNHVRRGGMEADAAVTCGECHDVDFISRHSSHPARITGGNCLLCHTLGDPDEPPLRQFDHQGRFTAAVKTPDSVICGQCHGAVTGREGYLDLGAEYLKGDRAGSFRTTLKTGEIFSPQLVSDSFLNLAEKNSRQWPWDIHAARGLECSTCHFAANNPERSALIRKQVLRHLRSDPRSLSISNYLRRPDHRLNAADCVECHDPLKVHQKLPYKERHLSALACQSCHTPTLLAPALRAVDYTVVTLERGPAMELRGVQRSESTAPNTWYSTGYRPFLLEERSEGVSKFAPYNMVARWEWVHAEEGKPVPAQTVEQAWLSEDGSYAPEVLQAFDGNGNSTVDPHELRLDSTQKTDVIRGRLEALGVTAPRISGTVTAQAVRHGVREGKQVAADCGQCHGKNSRFNETIPLSDRALPGGVLPVADQKATALLGRRSVVAVDGALQIAGSQQADNRYIIGHTHQAGVDWLGYFLFVLTALGVAVHAGLRYLGARRRGRPPHEKPAKRVYMYGMYERLWHWTMAACVILLGISGLQLHYPQSLELMTFATATFVHNLLAIVLIANAFLSLFFHLATGEIRQYVPPTQGLVKSILSQAWYYTKGIFVGATHPIPKTPEKKLNPLQQITYVGLLNVLFPLQIATGILLWVGGKSPDSLTAIGGISIIAPIHNLTSWLFLSFVVMHVYLTTTGHTLLSNLKAMVDGWDEIEVQVEETGSQQGGNS